MLNSLKALLAKFVTKQVLDQLGQRFRAWAIVAIDAGIAYVGTLIYQWINTPTDNDVILRASDAFTASGSAAGFATLTAVVSFVIRVVLPILVTLFSSTPTPPVPPAALLLVFLVFPAATGAAPISGPSSSPVAHFIAQDLPKTSIPVWVVTPEPDKGGYRTNDDGSFDVWGPPGVTHKVILIEILRDGSQVRTEHVFTFGGNAPAPTPPAPPGPPLPDGNHGLTKWAYGIASAYSPTDRARAHEIAAAMRTTSQQLASKQPIKLTVNGTVKTYDSTPDGLQKAFADEIASCGGSWPQFSSQLGDKIRSITDVKRQTSFWVTAWNATADGVDRAGDAK